MRTPIVSALVSTWSAERFMRGLLENLEAQTIADQVEILIVDSASPQNEAAIVREFQQHYSNIRYLRTDCRENSHATLNRAIGMASGKYLTIANTDDRHRVDAFEIMVRALEQNPQVGLVYPDTLIGRVPNEQFATTTASLRHDWPDFNLGTALSCCLFGALPMWRRSVHESVGVYNPDFEIAGDHDLYTRIAWRYGALHIRETLGLFLQRDDSNSGADNRERTAEDVMRVMRGFRREIPLDDFFPGIATVTADASARVAALVELGCICACGPYNDLRAAFEFFQSAANALGQSGSSTAQFRVVFANNIACVLALMGLCDKASSILTSIVGDATAASNQEALTRLMATATPLHSSQFVFLGLDHSVVSDSRRAQYLSLGDAGLFNLHETVRVPWDVYEGPNGVVMSSDELQRAKAGLPRLLPVVSTPVETSSSTLDDAPAQSVLIPASADRSRAHLRAKTPH